MWIDLQADLEKTRQILAASQKGEIIIRLEVARPNGLAGFNLYGARMGAYPVEPTLFVECMVQ